MIIQAVNFNNRKELERYISAEVGTDIKKNIDAGHTIQGKREELKRLRLNDTSTIYGIKCVITDTPTSQNKGKKVAQIKK